MRHTQINKPCLFLAEDHFDGKAQRPLSFLQEAFGVTRHPQGVGANRTYRITRKPAQSLAHTTQRFQSTQLRRTVQPSFLIKSCTQPYRFANGIEQIDLTLHHSPHL